MNIGTLLSAVNEEMQANALFPSGLGPNRAAASKLGGFANICLATPNAGFTNPS